MRALESQVTRLLRHLLEWRFQPERRTGSWHLTIRDARRQIGRILKDSPSLGPYPYTVFDCCYADAETGLPADVFPVDSPFSRAEFLDSRFLPD